MISEVLKGRNTLAFGAAEDNDDDPRLLEGIGDRSDCVGMLLWWLSWILEVVVVLTMVWVKRKKNINGIYGREEKRREKEMPTSTFPPKVILGYESIPAIGVVAGYTPST